MASRVIYLEVDDEITSAAARIRDADASRIAVVLPYGSRVATSRINFRLLSRDALTHEKRLSVVAADPATRALAASAGLPVFASVAEYESSLAAGEEDRGGVTATPPVAPVGTAAGARPAAAEEAPPAAVATPGPASDGTLGLVVPVAAAGVVAGATLGETVRVPVPRDSAATLGPRSAEPTMRPSGAPSTAVVPRAIGRGIPRTPWLVGGAILALAVLVAGVGAYVLLPAATIVVTPRPERIGPIDLTVTADTNASQPDTGALVVPATEVSVPVAVNDTFNATGKRVQLIAATGTVRFDNLDPTSTNRIVAGSIVRTASGVRFRTAVTITVPRAELIQVGLGFSLTPGRLSVKVTAVDGGPDGNVDQGTIVVVPSGENSLFLKVTNPGATSGGNRQEFTRITQADVDGALAALNASLQGTFQEALADPSLAAGGATVFPTTGKLGPTTPTVDPATLVGQEVATFDLGLSANGTVVTVDSAPVARIAETQLRATVKPDHELVAGSVDIQVGDAVVVGQSVSFPVSASAEQVAILDPATLKEKVLGKPVADARAILAPYGQVDLTVWPDWAGSVPTFGSRVDLSVKQAVRIETPAPSGSTPP
jgi:hypothetical protein